MNRAGSIFRRRKSIGGVDDSSDVVTSQSVERSALSLRTTERELSVESRPFDNVTRRRGARSRTADASTFHSFSTAVERFNADSIPRSMAKKWFGIEETGEGMDLPPSSSVGTGYVRSWLERTPAEPSPRTSDSAEAKLDPHTTPNPNPALVSRQSTVRRTLY